MALPAPLARLVRELTRLPGIGEKTATRLAFFLLRSAADLPQSLADSISRVQQEICLCSSCLAFADATPCPICADPARSDETLCIVEDPADVLAVERAGDFKGRYHVLHGALAPLEGIGPGELKMAELLERLKSGVVKEIIVATNPTVEGEATAMYLARLIKPLGVKVSRIATGLPMGGELEYTDQATIARALAHRAVL